MGPVYTSEAPTEDEHNVVIAGGAELRATNKIRPANARTTVPDFGGIEKLEFPSTRDEHGNMQVGCGRCARGNLPFSLRLSAVTPMTGLQPEGGTKRFRLAYVL